MFKDMTGEERVKVVIAAIWAGAISFVFLVGGIVTLAMFDKDVTVVLSALGSVMVVMLGGLGTLLYARMGQVKDTTNGQMTRMMEAMHMMAQSAMDQSQKREDRADGMLR